MSYNQFTPGGSYQLTSRKINVTINAECKKKDGSWQQSKPFSYTADDAQAFLNIANDDGNLVKIVTPPAGTIDHKYGIAIPAGGYQATSRNIKVTIEAECKKKDGSWQPSKPLEYDTQESQRYPEGVVNNNGQLSFTM